MLDNQIGRRYAKAIYDIAENEKLIKPIHKVLNEVMELYKEDAEFKDFILHPLIDIETKEEVIKKIVKVDNEKILDIIFYVLEKGRIIYIKDIVTEYLKIYYERNKILDIVATFTRKLSKDEKDILKNALEARTKQKVHLEVEVDKNIIGGGIIKIGDQILDGSIRKDLDSLKQK